MLYDACKNGDLEKVKDILSEDSSLLNEGLNKNGRTCLFIASYWNHAVIVSFLLELDKIDVNKANNKLVILCSICY
jgi:ankyrin repeat protein